MCNRAAHACAASYRQRQRVPSLLSAPSEYTQHSGSRRRLPQASYSWSVRQDTQHKRKLRPPQKNRRTALAFLRKLPPGRTMLRRLFALLAVTVATALPPLVRRRTAHPHRAAAAPAKSKRRRCPRCPRPLLPLCPPVPSPKRPQLSPYPKPLPPYPDEASLRHTPRTPMRLLFPDVNS